MASTTGYHDFVMELLSGVKGIRTRKMMGEYVLYLDDRVIGGIYDDELLLKPAPSLVGFFPHARTRFPYEGSKTLMIVVDSEDPSLVGPAVESLRQTND